MAFYLVHGTPKEETLAELGRKLDEDAFCHLRPFGRAMSFSLRNARRAEDGRLVWEEEDYCSPPLAEEREAVLDEYFEELDWERVAQGDGWRKIEALPRAFE